MHTFAFSGWAFASVQCTLFLTALAPVSKKFAELEQIKSLVQLRAEVPAYFELVQRFGGDANRHIERVAGLLGQAVALKAKCFIF